MYADTAIPTTAPATVEAWIVKVLLIGDVPHGVDTNHRWAP